MFSVKSDGQSFRKCKGRTHFFFSWKSKPSRNEQSYSLAKLTTGQGHGSRSLELEGHLRQMSQLGGSGREIMGLPRLNVKPTMKLFVFL